MNTTDDAKTAHEAIAAIMEKAGVAVTFSPPSPGTDPELPCIAYIASINGVSQEYRLGVGHVKYPKNVPFGLRLTPNEEHALHTLQRRPYAKLEDPALHASLAAKLARVQGVKPDAVELIVNMARDGVALLLTFEDWCSEFGYDTDSRKAEATYTACCECGRKLRKLFTSSQIEAIEKLGAEL